MQNKNYQYFIYSLLYLLLYSCSSSRPGLPGKKTPHEHYEKKIKDGGKKETPLTEAWLKEAAITLSNPLDIWLPYSETGYFPANRANGIGLRFAAKRGQKINISLTKKNRRTLQCMLISGKLILFQKTDHPNFYQHQIPLLSH